MQTNNTDRLLSLAFEHDERKAFDLIFTRYYSKVKRFAMSFCGDEFEADNIAQDIFLKLWLKRNDISGIENLESYIYAMVRNTSLNLLRNMARQTNIDGEDIDLADESDIEELVNSHELMDFVRRQIDLMPKQQRKVFTMSRIDGLKNEEIAEQLHISKRTVETHISAALATLRRLIVVAVLEILTF